MYEIVPYLVGLLVVVGVSVLIYGLHKLQTDRYNEKRKSR